MKILKDTTKFGKFFSESYFWKKLQKKVKKIGMKVTYAALLCYYVLKSPDVPKKDKAKIYGALYPSARFFPRLYSGCRLLG